VARRASGQKKAVELRGAVAGAAIDRGAGHVRPVVGQASRRQLIGQVVSDGGSKAQAGAVRLSAKSRPC